MLSCLRNKPIYLTNRFITDSLMSTKRVTSLHKDDRFGLVCLFVLRSHPFLMIIAEGGHVVLVHGPPEAG